jgi:hypothetical protein
MDSLYACLFSNGHIKVGKTTNLPARIKHHCDRVACVGAVLTDLAHRVVCDGQVEARERWLISLCADRAGVRHQSEWFAGLEFNTVRAWCTQAAELEIPPHHLTVAEEVAPAGVHADWSCVERIGPANVARLIGITIQRVQNWKHRGIPARVKLQWPDLFNQEHDQTHRKPESNPQRV